jgi:phosphoadenosine phosphosulfate reductase
MVNPIVDWTDKDVWEFLYHYHVEVNPLYQVKAVGCAYCPCGNTRVGCVVCPMKGGNGMKADLIKYPKYRDNYLRAFDRMLQARKAARLEISDKWRDARSVMMWWVGDDPRQLSLLGEPEYLKGACL